MAQMWNAPIILTGESWPTGPSGRSSTSTCAVIQSPQSTGAVRTSVLAQLFLRAIYALNATSRESQRSLRDLAGKRLFTYVTRNGIFPVRPAARPFFATPSCCFLLSDPRARSSRADAPPHPPTHARAALSAASLADDLLPYGGAGLASLDKFLLGFPRRAAGPSRLRERGPLLITRPFHSPHHTREHTSLCLLIPLGSSRAHMCE